MAAVVLNDRPGTLFMNDLEAVARDLRLSVDSLKLPAELLNQGYDPSFLATYRPDELGQFVNRTEPLSLWADNTNDAMLNGVLRSVALYLQAVVRQFVQEYRLESRQSPHVYVTGSDGPLLMNLLDLKKCHCLLVLMANGV